MFKVPSLQCTFPIFSSTFPKLIVHAKPIAFSGVSEYFIDGNALMNFPSSILSVFIYKKSFCGIIVHFFQIFGFLGSLVA